jgi:hypothetical protein
MIPTALPRLLLIAGTGRDSGKTTFICHIIKQFKDAVPLVAIKISSHRHKFVPGGKVVIQDDHFTIIEENDAQTGKDSSRMLAAGASRSFFVMATDEQLVKAIDKIINLNGSDTYYICESGGLRQYVVPGVFILVSHHGENQRKQRPSGFTGFPDAMITFDGQQHQFNRNRIIIAENSWKIKSDDNL